MTHEKDRTQALDAMRFSEGLVKAVKEPNEGHEELEAIPNSFAIEFDDGGSWSMFTDTVEEKVCISFAIYISCMPDLHFSRIILSAFCTKQQSSKVLIDISRIPRMSVRHVHNILIYIFQETFFSNNGLF